MSGKPASVAATRAGAPRLLVYVADPRQLEPGAAGPEPAALPRPPPPRLPARAPPLHNDQRALPNTIFYKSLNENDTNLNAYGSADNTVQRTDIFVTSQQEEINANERPGSVNINNTSQLGQEFEIIEPYGVPTEAGSTATYQGSCAGSVADNIMPPMQSLAICQGPNQFDSFAVQSDRTNCIEGELVAKSYVNYQFLEQSVSHQSIVNQSISILNQQVGVNGGSEGDSGSGAQLVRTPDGVVLAVLPPSVLPQPAEGQDLPARTLQSDAPQTITVPLGWRRIINGNTVIYLSPSGTALSTLPQLKDYLQTTGTCKCGLPCPLRPETTFSFDPKVVSQPYQATSDAELTNLCNHKRKLLASLQAGAQTTTPPPLEQKKVTGTEVGMLKKKMNKRAGFPPNMSVSQLMVQRETTLGDLKLQENDLSHTTVSPGVGVRPNQSLPPFSTVQNMPNPFAQEELKQDTQVQRSSHYLTVNSGWITQQENLDPKPIQPSTTSNQIQSSASSNKIQTSQASNKIQTSQASNKNQAPASNQNKYPPNNKTHPYPASGKAKSSPTNNKILNIGMPVRGTNGQIIGVDTSFNTNYRGRFKNSFNFNKHKKNSNVKNELKDEKKDLPEQKPQSANKPAKEEESQIFCGLNQPLTPEVMQKINEQQQIFIQQNQKQIEMARKGYKTQLAENVNQNNPPTPNQYVPQAQLVIQNGAVVKTNPAKTPPWQVKRNDCNAMTAPSPKLNSDNVDFDDSTNNTSEDSSGSFSPFPNSEQQMNQMCARVPPLPQHYNMLGQQWPAVDANNKKKTKTTNKGVRKKASPNDSKVVNFNNQGVMQENTSGSDGMPSNSLPSFMDDPSGYLAQQTVLLNNTISKQVGINSSFDSLNQFDNRGCYNQQGKQISRPCDGPNVYRGNIVPNPSPSPNNTPDSSVFSERGPEQCCKGCNMNTIGNQNQDFADNQMLLKDVKRNIYTIDMDGNLISSSPRHGFDDNPVTSSTFDRSPMNDNCPIQAGTVSTSNVSPPETLQPEPSPTLSNSSRSTDTPHSHSSGGNSGSHMPTNCNFPMPSPAYSNPGSFKDVFNSNPSTPNNQYPYNAPGPPNNQITGTQMMHFISNHNVNKNLMEVDNISMVGVKPVNTPVDSRREEPRKGIENCMPGYCPPPHLGGGPAHSLVQACYVQTFITTMASFSVTRDTVTSVLAGKANTSTTSINASQANFVRPPPPPSVNLATSYAIPNNQPDPFINSVNLPTSYPLHIAGTTAQNMISKTPLEIAQNVMGSPPPKSETNNIQINALPGRRSGHTTPGQILISSTGQIIVSSNQMPPPPPKTSTTIAQIQGSNTTNVSTSVTQVVPTGVQPLVNQSTVVVNALPTPFVIQPPMMAVDGQVVQQNAVLPQMVTGVVSGSPNESPRQMDVKNSQNFVQGVAMLSPESLKKRKKKKGQSANITNILQITAPQQNSNNIMVHSSPQQHNTSPQFSPRGFQLSPNNNISPTPMLQALTIVPGKSGTPAHIVMNGQGTTNNFGSQQIITNTSPSQQINLLQPVNLINNASGVVPNFPAFQQLFVPNLGGMVMTADGTIIQDNSTGMPMQLQLQTVNGQNVLTPVQNPGVFAAGTNGGVVLRAQNQQGKIIQSQHSPGAQFLSPNSQVMMNSPNFNGQLSPLINLSPPNVSFNTSPPQIRSSNVQTQEFIQTNQMGQTLMLPLSPKQVSLASSSNRSNSTFVQNTTIVQQQTTLVSNSRNALPSMSNSARLSIDPNVLLSKQMSMQNRFIEKEREENLVDQLVGELKPDEDYVFMKELGTHVRQSVSTQTLRRSPNHAGGSPPDTTTHSPLGEAGGAPSGGRCLSIQAHYADTTTESPEPADASSSAMVQCVSSSEPDMLEWVQSRHDFNHDDTQNMMSNIPMMRQNRTPHSVEAEMHYSQTINTNSISNQHLMPVSSNYYDAPQAYKRKNDFGDGSTYRNDKIMRTNNGMVHGRPNDDFDNLMMSAEKTPMRHFSSSGSSTDNSLKVFDTHNLGSGDDTEENEGEVSHESGAGDREFSAGDLVWGPVKGYSSWPGKLQAAADGGRWVVRWFGGRAPSAVPAARLLTLSEGLEAHHAARTKHRKSRKLNTLLENAIQEAMAELDKKTSDSQQIPGDSAKDSAPITETPRRKKEKIRKEKHKKKSAPGATKAGDSARLRSAR